METPCAHVWELLAHIFESGSGQNWGTVNHNEFINCERRCKLNILQVMGNTTNGEQLSTIWTSRSNLALMPEIFFIFECLGFSGIDEHLAGSPVTTPCMSALIDMLSYQTCYPIDLPVFPGLYPISSRAVKPLTIPMSPSIVTTCYL